MTLQLGKQTITIHLLLNISRRKGNQTKKLGQLIEITRETLLFKNHTENEIGRLVTDVFF